ncbi:MULTISPECIES: polysaccharide deacetylase family protein [unclassified Virgibacillus]|uniref:polysaccharide deacetylase family protein n=1 Tax=unclassified Virgibacillus TaxID=2620237 RepID=UPI0024DE57CD|nr:polysaccharide deacetylase family protein [Virgibacillus sp. LDC-1]
MKKIIVLLFACVWMVLSIGCSNSSLKEEGSDTEKNEETKPQTTTPSEKAEKQEEESNTVAKEEEQTKEEPDANKPMYRINDKTWHIQPIDPEGNKKIVLLTIDDAPDEHALEMAKTLKKLDANAIFFVNGHFLETNEKKEILKEIHDMGFVIGNHTYSHPSLSDIDEQTQKEEILRVNDMVEAITGERPKIFRAPFGDNTSYSNELLQQENMIRMNWVYGHDWEKQYQSKDAITDIMLHNQFLGNGANLLMHDREWTAAALEDIVNGLREQGFEIANPALIETK